MKVKTEGLKCSICGANSTETPLPTVSDLEQWAGQHIRETGHSGIEPISYTVEMPVYDMEQES